jgi:uncharacterized membrane protein
MRPLALALSIMLHPLLMPVYALALAFSLDIHISFFLDERGRWIILGMVAIMTVVFPMLSIALLWRSGLVTDLAMPKRAERTAPYVMTLFYQAMAYYLLRRNDQDPALLALLTGGMAALLLTLLINLRWKISAHLVGMGGLLGGLTGLLLLHRSFAPVELAPVLLAVGALGTARLLISDHTPAQVHAGAALGFLTTFGCVIMERYV